MINKSTIHKFIVCVTVLVVFFGMGMKPVKNREKLPWMKLTEAEAAARKLQKPILLDLYTDWCGWCKVMDKKTYSDKKLIRYVMEKFYPVKLNAETREDISWSGKTYGFSKSNRTNDFAMYLTQGRLSYPTTVIIPADGSGPQAIPGYLTPKEMEIILKYFGEGRHGRISFAQYEQEFRSTW